MKSQSGALRRTLVLRLVLLSILLPPSAHGRPSASHLGPTAPPKPPPIGIYTGGGRTVGDILENALPIPSVPFHDVGNTCGFSNDYDETCPYGGSTAPDMVYRYVPMQDQVLNIFLCDSQYDTKFYVYRDTEEDLVGCNDDGCGYDIWQSSIYRLPVENWHTYYIVIGGYGSSCGPYALDIEQVVPCVVPCPSGAIAEGEPRCRDGYVDVYNGGCSATPPAFQPLQAQDGGCATLCGLSCTFRDHDMSYRDTDWFDCIGTGQTVTARCTSEFWLQFILIWQADCNDLLYEITTRRPCETAELSRSIADGTHFWLWVGPQVFSGMPVSPYVLEVCGVAGPRPGACCLFPRSCRVLPPDECRNMGGAPLGEGTVCDPDPCPPPVPVEQSTWGGVKAKFVNPAR